MKFQQINGIRFLTFDIFPKEVIHAVFTRQGGLSPEPWSSLNVGGTVGDDVDVVRNNRYRSFEALGRDRNSIFDVWQVHSADVVIANLPLSRSQNAREYKADGIVTNNPDVSLFMRFADCTPILLFDPVNMAIGIVHAGWKGTVKQVVMNTIKTMQAAYGTKSHDICAAIGPAIGPDHYEVGPDVLEQAQYAFGNEAKNLLLDYHGKLHFNLWAANELILKHAEVSRVEVAGLCTACNPDDWYSHRAQKGKTGRFGALISLAGK